MLRTIGREGRFPVVVNEPTKAELEAAATRLDNQNRIEPEVVKRCMETVGLDPLQEYERLTGYQADVGVRIRIANALWTRLGGAGRRPNDWRVMPALIGYWSENNG